MWQNVRAETYDRSSLIGWCMQKRVADRGVDMRSLRIALDLRGIGSADRTGSVSLKGTKDKEMRVKQVK